MRKTSLALLALLCLTLFTPAAKAAQEPQITRLPNGLTVLVLEDQRFPLASVRLYVKAGSAFEEPEQAGISHMLEHMVFKGSATNEQIDFMVENAGGYMNAYTSYDETCYYIDLPARNWQIGLTALRDLAFDPLLLPEDLAAERPVVLAEYQIGLDQPITGLVNTMDELALAGTPYEKPVIGYPDTINAMTPESLREYYDLHYNPAEMLLVVVGAVDAAEVNAEALALFGHYPNLTVRSLPQPIATSSLEYGLQVEVQSGAWNKAHLVLGFPVPHQNAAEQSALNVLTNLLGGDQTSLLYRQLHLERPLADFIEAGILGFERTGQFFIYAITDREKLPELTTALAEILADLQTDSFSEAELARVKLKMQDTLWRGMETISDLAATVGGNYFSRKADPLGEDELVALGQVDWQSLDKVIAQYLNPQAMTLVAIAPQNTESETEAATADRELRETLTQNLLAAWPQAAAAPVLAESLAEALPIDLEHPQVIDLGQGRTVVLNYDNSLPYVSVSLAFLGGNQLVPADRQGLAALAAEVITSATSDLDHNTMLAYQADRAASLWAAAEISSFSFGLDAPAQHGTDLFELLLSILAEPQFRDSDIERTRQEMQTSILTSEESSQGVLNRNLNPFLFADNAYSFQSGGSIASLAAISRADLQAFWAGQQGRPWVLSVGGAFDQAEILALAERLPLPSQPALEPALPIWNQAQTKVIDLPDREQAAYALLFPAVPLTHPDSAALTLLTESLSGFSGLLFQELREKNSLGYSVRPLLWQDQATGFIGFSIICESANLEQAEIEFFKIVEQLSTQAQAQDVIDRAKINLENNYYTALQRRLGRVSSFGSNILFGRDADSGLQRLQQAMQLTPEDLREVAARYLAPDQAFSIQVRP